MIQSDVLYCIFILGSKMNTVSELYQVGAEQRAATAPFKWN